jgi:APA family basic amino acid/polyamine antiporter
MHDNNSLTAPNRAANPDALLSRDLGTRQLAANIFNYTVGTGIFVLPATAVARLGAAAPLAYVVCAVIIGLVVLCFAEAGSRVTTTGGPYAYVETSLGPMMGFVAGCLVLSTGTSAAAFAANAVSQSLLALFPGTASWVAYALILLLIAVLVAINLRGVRIGSRVTEIATVAKLFPLLAFVAIGVFFVDPANLAWDQVPTASAVLGSAGIVIYAFSGIEGSLVPSGEVKNPSRSVPRAAFLALGSATLLYIAIQFVALGILGPDLATDKSPVPLANAAARAVGPIGKTILIAGAIISIFGYLSANVLSEPRGIFAFSRDGFLPRTLAAVHPRFHTPYRSILLYGVVVAIIALTGTFERLAIFANLAALILYFLCAIAAWNLRRRNIRSEGEPFLAPGGPLVPIAACASIAWLFYETVDRGQLVALAIVLAIIFALYGIRYWRLKVTAT